MFDLRPLVWMYYGSMVFWPLGAWKAIEILIWLAHHIHFSVKP